MAHRFLTPSPTADEDSGANAEPLDFTVAAASLVLATPAVGVVLQTTGWGTMERAVFCFGLWAQITMHPAGWILARSGWRGRAKAFHWVALLALLANLGWWCGMAVALTCMA